MNLFASLSSTNSFYFLGGSMLVGLHSLCGSLLCSWMLNIFDLNFNWRCTLLIRIAFLVHSVLFETSNFLPLILLFLLFLKDSAYPTRNGLYTISLCFLISSNWFSSFLLFTMHFQTLMTANCLHHHCWIFHSSWGTCWLKF